VGPGGLGRIMSKMRDREDVGREGCTRSKVGSTVE